MVNIFESYDSVIVSVVRMTASLQRARRIGPALDAHYRLILWLVPTLAGFPRSQKFLLGDRIQGIALDILEELIDATYSKDRDGPLSRANLSIEKLRFLFRLSRDLGYLDMRRHEFIMRSLEEIGRRIGAWKKTNRSHENA